MKNPKGVEAYPLHWPDGWPRTPKEKRQSGLQFRSGSTYEGYGDQKRYVGRKSVTFNRASILLFEELARMKARDVVVSTNARARKDGGVYAEDAERRYEDPGVAVYFMLKGRPMVMAQDAFETLAANVRSLGLAIEAMRALERHGGGHMMERAFAGFSALPPPEGSRPRRPWWEVMRYSADPEERELLTPDEIEARFRALAKRLHPDVDGGSHEAMSELNQAREDALAELGEQQ